MCRRTPEKRAFDHLAASALPARIVCIGCGSATPTPERIDGFLDRLSRAFAPQPRITRLVPLHRLLYNGSGSMFFKQGRSGSGHRPRAVML